MCIRFHLQLTCVFHIISLIKKYRLGMRLVCVILNKSTNVNQIGTCVRFTSLQDSIRRSLLCYFSGQPVANANSRSASMYLRLTCKEVSIINPFVWNVSIECLDMLCILTTHFIRLSHNKQMLYVVFTFSTAEREKMTWEVLVHPHNWLSHEI